MSLQIEFVDAKPKLAKAKFAKKNNDWRAIAPPVHPPVPNGFSMLDQTFEWVSNERTRVDLVQFIQETTHNKEEEAQSQRRSALNCLAMFATDNDRDFLSDIVLSETEEYWMRIYALRILNKLKPKLSRESIQQIIRQTYDRTKTESFVFNDSYLVLELTCQIDSEQQLKWFIESFLDTSAEFRAQFLLECQGHGITRREWTTKFIEWLFDQWIREFEQVSTHKNLGIARCYRYRQSIGQRYLQLLLEAITSDTHYDNEIKYSRDYTYIGHLKELITDPDLQDLKQQIPERWSQAVDLLDDLELLNHELSIDQTSTIELSDNELISRVQELMKKLVVEAKNNRWRVFDLFLKEKYREQRLLLMNNIERILSSAGDSQRLIALLESEAFPWFMRRHIEDAMIERFREQTVSWLTINANAGKELTYVTVLEKLAYLPEEYDQALYQSQLQNSDPCIVYAALEGLDRLDSDIPETLHAGLLKHSDPFVQLRFCAYLFRRGQLEYGKKLAAVADSESHYALKAEAVRWLAVIDPISHCQLFSRLTVTNRECTEDFYNHPVLEEAAYGLAFVGSDEALTALVRLALVAPGNPISSAVESYIDFILTKRRGETPTQCLHYVGHGRYAPPRNCEGPHPEIYPVLWRSTRGSYPG